MRVYCYPADRTGCGMYRMRAPADALAAQGHDVAVVYPDGRSGENGIFPFMDDDGNVDHVVIPVDAEVMVFQRITLLPLAQAIPLIRAKGVAVVVDMDDDLTCIDPRNAAWTAMHPRHGQPGHSWANATQACMDATLVTVSTPALLRTYAPHGRGIVLENRIPASYLDIPHEDSATIGWAGLVASHPGDLPVVGRSVTRLVREGAGWLSVGDGVGVRTELGLDDEPETTGYVDLADWPHAVARLGIGIAPLVDTKFNSSKSWLKPLEMAAVGVPWVGSPRAEYRKLHALGCGLLAESPKDWYRKLRALVRDPSLRVDLGTCGRMVAAEMTIEEHAFRWAEAWALALDVQRDGRPTLVHTG